MEEMKKMTDTVFDESRITPASAEVKDKDRTRFSDRLQEAWGPALNRNVGKAGKISWGLLILGLVAAYAVFNLVKAVLFFF